MSQLTIRIIRIKKLQEIIGLSRSTIYEKMNKKSKRYDQNFPKPIKLSSSAIGWLISDIEAWLELKTTYVNQ